MKKKLLLVDGNSIFHRSYHAIPLLKTSSGEPVNAVYGFTSMLLYALEKEKPDMIAIAFDKGKKTFRSKMFEAYKAHRPASPEDLYVQLPRVKEILDAFGICYLEHEDFEADDVIGTLSSKASATGEILTTILSSDMDTLQLVSDDILVAAPKSFKDWTYYSPATVKGKYGLTPTEFLEYKGLKGDSSDNIPGVHGIGSKTAIKLLHKYQSIEKIYQHIDEIEGAVKKRLEQGRETANLSKKLATIVKDGPFELNTDDFSLKSNFSHDKIIKTFNALEFSNLTSRLFKLFPAPIITQKEKNSEQIALF